MKREITIEMKRMTIKAKNMLDTGEFTKDELSKTLDISRPTLDTRLKEENWKKGEIVIIKAL